MELLAPAGSWESFMAAISHGADAVYLGGKEYSARQFATNFSDDEIKKAVEIASLKDKKIYLTMNTLILNDEFNKALDYIYKNYEYGIDAVIVQDIGLLHALRQLLPDLNIHASTQMTIHNVEGIEFLKNYGVKRIILSRELSFTDLEYIKSKEKEIEIEIFVHGALCFSYSGQCLLSSFIGARSGNRGKCAQPCRLPYKLYTLEKQQIKFVNQGAHLLSLSDYSAIDHLKELKRIGINSLKIEGRMKRPEYVAVVCQEYRKALDWLEENNNYNIDADNRSNNLSKVFNRKLSSAYLFNTGESIINTQLPSNQGHYLGMVMEQDKELRAKIKLNDDLALGDGIEIRTNNDKNPSFIVKEIMLNKKQVDEASKEDNVILSLKERVNPRDKVFKTYDNKIFSFVQEKIQKELSQNKIPLDLSVYLSHKQAMRVIYKDKKGNLAEVESNYPPQIAEKHPLNEEILRKQLGRLGDTPFILDELSIIGEDNLILPISELNQLRRNAVSKLLIDLTGSNNTRTLANFEKDKKDYLAHKKHENYVKSTLLNIAVSNIEQAESALDARVDRIYLGIEGLGNRKKYNIKEIQDFKSRVQKSGSELVIALPRIQKASSKDLINDFIDKGFDSFMIRNWGALNNVINRDLNVFLDYNMNVANKYALNTLLDLGIKEICLSPELNFKHLLSHSSSQSFDSFAKVELLVHGDITVMVSEACIFKNLQDANKESCSKLCRQKNYYLEDAKSYQFPISTDNACKFYLFNSRTLCLIEELKRILNIKPASIRIEALINEAKEIKKIVETYRTAMDMLHEQKNINLAELKNELEENTKKQFTRGHFNRGV